MGKPSIPDTSGVDYRVKSILDPLKENVETITGKRGGTITQIGPTPTTQELATKINQILTLLQG